MSGLINEHHKYVCQQYKYAENRKTKKPEKTDDCSSHSDLTVPIHIFTIPMVIQNKQQSCRCTQMQSMSTKTEKYTTDVINFTTEDGHFLMTMLIDKCLHTTDHEIK